MGCRRLGRSGLRASREDRLVATKVRTAWIDATVALGGDRGAAMRSADDLVGAYGEPVRHYHGIEHVAFVLDRLSELGVGALARTEFASVQAAACAHDVVYRGRAGTDERDSADWARQALTGTGVGPEPAGRVHALVLATAEHRAPADDAGAVILLDADLAVLASEPDGYAAYVGAVRAEYAHVGDEQWRTGRGDVLRDLLSREFLYATATGREKWSAAARANMSAELAALSGERRGG